MAMEKDTLDAQEKIAQALKPTLEKEKLLQSLNPFADQADKLARALRPTIDMEKILTGFRLPDMRAFEVPKPPTQQEMNHYQSAAVLMEALANAALEWKDNLPKEFTPAILAVLYGGIQIQVTALAQVSFHGIRIEGTMQGAPCTLLAHQTTVQLLCYAEEAKPDRNPIGFIWQGNKVEV